MRKRLFLYQMMLVIVAVVIMAFGMFRITHDLYINELEGNLYSSGNLIENALINEKKTFKDEAEKSIYYQALAKDYHQSLSKTRGNDLRITIISLDGKVLGDSLAEPTTMGNHKFRQEVIKATHNGMGSDIRKSGTVNIDYLYCAVTNPDSDVIVRIAEPLVYINKIDRQIITFILLTILAGVVITALISFFLSKSLSKPVVALKNAMIRISEGDTGTRIFEEYKDEMKELTSGFNDMSEKLEVSMKSLEDKTNEQSALLENINAGILAINYSYGLLMINEKAKNTLAIDKNEVCVGKSIISLTRKTEFTDILVDVMKTGKPQNTVVVMNDLGEEKYYRVNASSFIRNYLDDDNDDNRAILMSMTDITLIKKLENVRSQFVSNVSHELKTPLTSIRGFVETLKKGAIDKPEVARDFLDIIDIESERLYGLINDILDLSEIETMKGHKEIERIEVSSVVGEVLGILTNEAENKNVTLIDDTKKGIYIGSNRNRVKQMLLNIIENGIKYNNPGGNVTVSSKQDEDGVEICVKDTGIGIPKEHQERIFERFYRVDGGRSRELGGNGLGLSIVKHIANIYNVDIILESDTDAGTTMRLKFKPL